VGSVKGDSESGAPAPSQTAEAAPAPGSLGETNALLRELVNHVTQQQPIQLAQAVSDVTAIIQRAASATAGPATVGLDVQADGVENSRPQLGLYGGSIPRLTAECLTAGVLIRLLAMHAALTNPFGRGEGIAERAEKHAAILDAFLRGDLPLTEPALHD